MVGRRSIYAGVLMVVFVSVACLLFGCVDVSGEDIPDWVPDWVLPQTGIEATPTSEPEAATEGEPSGWAEGVDPHGRLMPSGTHGHGTEVLLLGRSVTAGWFQHWGWDGEGPVVRDGFALYYGEIEAPPGIAESAVDYVSNVPTTTVVVFKLCFVDFWARTPNDVSRNLAENLAYVQDVVDAARYRGTRVVVMTSLPETRSNTNAALLDFHEAYDEDLAEIAAGDPGVWVFDINDVLADQTGALYRSFAASPSDAHLTEVAYLELDDALFAFLKREFGG